MTSFNVLKDEVFGREQRRQHFKDHVKGLTAFERHKAFIGDYVNFYGGKVAVPSVPLKTDQDTMRETYRFIRSEEDDAEASWEHRLARKYYSKLFKEYCLADMSRYKESKVGLRWRTQKEVVAGKGQFVCGAKGCEDRVGLHSYEAGQVNFGYVEAGEEKQALVKLRVCPKHGYHLNYRKEKEVEKRKRKEANKERKRRSVNGGEEAEATGRGDGANAVEEREDGKGQGEVENEVSGDGRGGVEGEGVQEDAEAGRNEGVEVRGGTLAGDESVWRGKLAQVEPNKEEEFDDYFRGMFL